MRPVPLWCKSNFSFLEGASHPEELVEACVALGIDALALTDRDGAKAREVGPSHRRAECYDVPVVAGTEDRVIIGSDPGGGLGDRPLAQGPVGTTAAWCFEL